MTAHDEVRNRAWTVSDVMLPLLLYYFASVLFALDEDGVILWNGRKVEQQQ